MIGELIGWGAGALAYVAGVALFWKAGRLFALTWPFSVALALVTAAGDREP
jgi:hypothetical protein